MLWVYFLSPVHMSDMSHSSQNGNPWFSATIGLLGLIVGYVVANAVHGYVPAAPAMPSAPTGGVASSSAAPSYNPPSVGDNSPVLGKDDAPVTIIEFTDFQCPFCERVEPTLKRIRPRAQGRAGSILKRTSHITVVVAEKG